MTNQKLICLFLLVLSICINAQSIESEKLNTTFENEFDNSVKTNLSIFNTSSVIEKYFSDNRNFNIGIIKINTSEPTNFSNNSYLSNSEVNFYNINEKLGFIKDRHPMEKTGRILTYIGVPLAIIGGIMVAGADELYYNCTNGDCTGDARGGFGVITLAAGGGLSITGIILWISGSKK